MRLLLYEWCCSGGMQSDIARDILRKSSLEDFLKEGRLMLEAIACDAEKNADLDITVMVDATLSATEAPHLSKHITVKKVLPGTNRSSLLDVASESDQIILIAPETHGILLQSLIAIEQAGFGDRLINCPMPFIHAASDKQTTSVMLAAAGIPTPAGRTLPPGGSIPAGFRLPAVLKARESAGCDGLRIIQNRSDFATPETDSRLECHIAGIPGSVCCLCRADSIIPLLPFEQMFTDAMQPVFIGGRLIHEDYHVRMQSLAVRSIEALNKATQTKARGWVGVDMILGSCDDGNDDRVLEINPRLTTSFIGLSRGQQGGLIHPLLNHIRGRKIYLTPWNTEACEFSLA
ncbi:MAG: ATP-grasp domain-containing protein [Pirellulales bacterium]